MAKKFHSRAASSEGLLEELAATSAVSARDYAANPLDAFRLMKRTSVVWRRALEGGGGEAKEEFLGKLPALRDFVYGAHFGLMAAQAYYDQGSHNQNTYEKHCFSKKSIVNKLSKCWH